MWQNYCVAVGKPTGWQYSCVAVCWKACWPSAGPVQGGRIVVWQCGGRPACRVAVDGWSHFLLLAPPSQERRPGGAGARPPSRKSRSSATACTAGPPSRSFRVRKLISEPAHRCTRPLTSGLFHCGAEVVTAAPRNQPPVLTLWCAALRHPQPVVVTRWENITSGLTPGSELHNHCCRTPSLGPRSHVNLLPGFAQAKKRT